MKSCSTNDIKIYNLTAGKSFPEWLPAQKKRKLVNKNVDIRRRIELIQDFDMPGLSSNVQVSPDGNFVLATGIYKPRVRCYDLKNLSMKFERCFDSEVVKFLILSQDYSKVVFLQNDRYIEFHAQYGRYFRLRIPKFGRDLAYHSPSCDLYVVGATNEVYRLNLEEGRFMSPLLTGATTINRVAINPVHHLLLFGTEEGRVEAWDPRAHKRVGELDVAIGSFGAGNAQIQGIPSVTTLTYKDGMTVGVGTRTGQVLLYDIRSSKPLLVKDHYYGLPIRDIEFHKPENLVMSMDSKIVKIWNEDSAEPFTSVEAEPDFNDLCLVPNSGMFFIANEDKKILTYYIPSMGPAPKWASFLDSLTEELEETNAETLYDDYKFVTEAELHAIGLGHLIGTNLLRGYMHGYYMDMRLYRKAKSALQPFEYGDFKKRKIREKLEQERSSRIKLNNLPKVNRELALKLMAQPANAKASKKGIGNALSDSRFGGLFSNPDFEIDKSTEEYRLLNPALTKLDKKKDTKKFEAMFSQVSGGNQGQEAEEVEGRGSSEDEESSDSSEGLESEEDEARAQLLQKSKQQKQKQKSNQSQQQTKDPSQPKFYEIKRGEDFRHSDLTRVRSSESSKMSRASLGERISKDEGENGQVRARGALGSREMTFKLNPKRQDFRKDAWKHHEERKKVRRSAGGLKNKKKAWKS